MTRRPAADLLQVPDGQITEAGLKQNVAVGLGYVEAWLRGIGCVPLFNLMEDAATAEISRAQLWQWVHHGAKLSDGRVIDVALVDNLIDAELARQQSAVDATRFAAYQKAARLYARTCPGPEFRRIPDGARLRACAQRRNLYPSVAATMNAHGGRDERHFFN